MVKTRALDKEKLKALHRAQEHEDLEYLEEGTCPWTKQPCEQMKKGRLVLVSIKKPNPKTKSGSVFDLLGISEKEINNFAKEVMDKAVMPTRLLCKKCGKKHFNLAKAILKIYDIYKNDPIKMIVASYFMGVWKGLRQENGDSTEDPMGIMYR